MTNTQMDIANEEINRRAFDRAWDWFCESLFEELIDEGVIPPEPPDEEKEPVAFAAGHKLFDERFEEAEESGELAEFLEPEGPDYTRAYNREEAEYLFHVLAARSDDGPLEAHFEFLKPFGITPENIDDEDSDENTVVVTE